MKKLIIVGGGVVGHSLLLALRKYPEAFSQIVLYDAPDFFPTCALNSTAIVAPRGVSSGHSELGDLLVESFQTFSSHVTEDRPSGVQKISQYTGTKSRPDQFLKRYPDALAATQAGDIKLNHEFLLSHEEAYQVTPSVYLNWIRTEVQQQLPVEFKRELFMATEAGTGATIVYCAGIANQVWDQNLKIKPAQGSYLEFSQVNFPTSSFSLTLEGHNLIYHREQKTLLIGSTTAEVSHYLAPVDELRLIHTFMSEAVDLSLPPFEMGIVKVGMREKAPKRQPYIQQQRIGGLYKNGFIAGLEVSRRWCDKYLQDLP